MEDLNNTFNTTDLVDIMWVQETDAKMGLGVPEVYWGNCLRRIKRRKQEEAGRAFWPQCSSERNEKEGEMSRKSLSLQCGSSNGLARLMGWPLAKVAHLKGSHTPQEWTCTNTLSLAGNNPGEEWSQHKCVGGSWVVAIGLQSTVLSAAGELNCTCSWHHRHI